MQVYRGLPILTNQPAGPAHLVGIWGLDHEASVAEYARLAREGLRLLRVDGAHTRAGHRAAENGRVQHARQPNVLRVHRAAGDAVAAVDARSGATDLRSWRAVA